MNGHIVAIVVPAVVVLIVFGFTLRALLRKAGALPPAERPLRGDAEAIAARIEKIADNLMHEADSARKLAEETRGARQKP